VVPQTGVVLLLVPVDPLRPRRADEHFAAEAAAARDAASPWRSSIMTRWPVLAVRGGR
jgi:hypothetical protein